MKKTLVVFLLTLIILFLFQSLCLAHEEPDERPPTEVQESSAPAPGTNEPVLPDAPDDMDASSGSDSYAIRHDIVRWLAYFLLALIVLTVASGFLKGKKVYRKIHHALAFTTLLVALSHGILALTL